MEMTAPLSRPFVGGDPASLSAFRNRHQGETVVVCIATYRNRKQRDDVMKKVMADQRLRAGS